MLLGSLRDQLIYPRLENEISEAGLRKVLETVRLEDLPERVGGFDVVLDWADVLSLGEQQRLAFARLLVNRPGYAVLDEATSALDAESEHQILKALERLRGKVTILMVAHRLATLSLADKILLFDKGRIVESGSWADLTKKKGMFDRLRQLQSTSV